MDEPHDSLGKDAPLSPGSPDEPTQARDESQRSLKSFFTSLPGILGSIAALLTAIAAVAGIFIANDGLPFTPDSSSGQSPHIEPASPSSPDGGSGSTPSASNGTPPPNSGSGQQGGISNGGPTRSPGSNGTAPADAASDKPTRPSGTKPRAPSSPQVTVTVSGTRLNYFGDCPPPRDQAPEFRAAIDVTSGPVDVKYRWRSSNGGSSDPDWRTIRFAGTGRQEQSVSYTDFTYLPEQRFEDWIAVDVESPVNLQSNRVGFTVTCKA